MSEEKLTLEETYKKFEEACAKFETWAELYEDDDFDISDNPGEALEELKKECSNAELIAKFNEECDGLTTFEEEVKRIETQIEFNTTTDSADQIYADILKYAKIIAPNLDKLGLDKEKFKTSIYNMGVCKSDIDDEKEMDEEFSDKSIYPKTKKVKPILDEEKLTKYLFG